MSRTNPIILLLALLPALTVPGDTSHTRSTLSFIPQVGKHVQRSSNEGVRTIWTAAEDGATVSPDGKLVAFIDWNSGHVAVRDLASNSGRPLTDKGSFANSMGFPEPVFVFSPTGDRLLFTYGNALAADPFRYELRMVGTVDTLQETVATYPPDVAFVAPLDWHAEAGILFTTVSADSSSELLIMHPNDWSVRVVERRTAKTGVIRQGFFTPSGKAVIYLSDGKLHRITLGGGASRLLGADADALLGWSVDGRRLILHGTYGNITGNWAVEVHNGRLIGKRTLVQPTVAGVLPAGRSVEGVYYLEPASVPRLFVVTLDLPAGHLIAAPKVFTPINNVAGNPTWSRDGSRLAFTLKVPNRTLHRIMVSQGLQQVPKEIASVDLRVMGLDWSADGNFLVIGGRADTRDSAWVGRINVTSGAIERLAWAPISAIAAGPKEEIAYVQAAPAGERTVRVILLPRVGAPPRVLASYVAEELPRSMSISPDGKWVAIMKSSEQRKASVLLLLPVEGGKPRTLLRLERPDTLELNVGSLPWSADGKKVLVLLRRKGKSQFAAVDVDSQELTLVPFSPEQSGRRQPALHPGGKQLVYVDGGTRNELKLMPSLGEISPRRTSLRGDEE